MNIQYIYSEMVDFGESDKMIIIEKEVPVL